MYDEKEAKIGAVDPADVVREVEKYYEDHPERLVARHRYYKDIEKLNLLLEKLRVEGKIVRFL